MSKWKTIRGLEVKGHSLKSYASKRKTDNFMKTVKLGTMNGIDTMARFFSWFLVISAIYLIWN